MQEIIDNFLEITKINHCSYQTQDLKQYIINFAKDYNYNIEVDSAKNILISSNNPKICLQAHYDMVCVGTAPKIEPIIEGNILKAKNSSLGADNGIAIAMMLELIKEGVEAEFLFTNDEEVGLIGAKNLELKIKSTKLLNLDSEDEAQVYIGCAGGIDIKATKELRSEDCSGSFYKVSLSNLPGGHSGVDIDKNIPNAIIELAKIIKQSGAKLCAFKGGERINSIPVNAEAILCCDTLESIENILIVKSKYNFEYKVIDGKYNCIDEVILEFLATYKSGVLDYNREFNVVQNSSNLALVDIKDTKATIEVSLRSMDNNQLENLSKVVKEGFEIVGFKTELNDKYPAWKPEINSFTKELESVVKEVFNRCEQKVIHAGLECGILSQKFPNIKIASIGPNIRFPHSKREFVEINSVYKTYEVVKRLI